MLGIPTLIQSAASACSNAEALWLSSFPGSLPCTKLRTVRPSRCRASEHALPLTHCCCCCCLASWSASAEGKKQGRVGRGTHLTEGPTPRRADLVGSQDQIQAASVLGSPASPSGLPSKPCCAIRALVSLGSRQVGPGLVLARLPICRAPLM